MVPEYHSPTTGGCEDFRVESVPDVTADFFILVPASYAFRMGRGEEEEKEIEEGRGRRQGRGSRRDRKGVEEEE